MQHTLFWVRACTFDPKDILQRITQKGFLATAGYRVSYPKVMFIAYSVPCCPTFIFLLLFIQLPGLHGLCGMNLVEDLFYFMKQFEAHCFLFLFIYLLCTCMRACVCVLFPCAWPHRCQRSVSGISLNGSPGLIFWDRIPHWNWSTPIQ